jgi:hypothetical protein
VLRRLYPVFAKNIKNESEEVRMWAFRKAGQIADLCEDVNVKYKIENELLKTWFSEDTKSDSELGREVMQQLMSLASKRLFEYSKTKAKGPDAQEKAKAEILLKELKMCLSPKRSIVHEACNET